MIIITCWTTEDLVRHRLRFNQRILEKSQKLVKEEPNT